MNFKINRKLLPIKAHFFFFFAALGPILPQLNVFGRQLGISPAAMGMVTAVLPLLWALAKPLFGYIVDFWPSRRKLVFMLIILLMSSSYCGLWFIPAPHLLHINHYEETKFLMNDTVYLKTYDRNTSLYKFMCHWNCSDDDYMFYLSKVKYVDTIYVGKVVDNFTCTYFNMDLYNVINGEVVCSARNNCILRCCELGKEDEDEDLTLIDRNVASELITRSIKKSHSNATKIKKKLWNTTSLPIEEWNDTIISIKWWNATSVSIDGWNGTSISIAGWNGTSISIDDWDATTNLTKELNSTGKAVLVEELLLNNDAHFYMTVTFWSFVILMCVGTVAFNVANCIGDAVCFDVLGEHGSKYGAQRAWGTAGYGLTALAGGYLVDLVSSGSYKNFTPAFIITIVATIIDMYSCRALNLPSLSSPEDSGKALREVLRIPRVVLFITFAVVAGTFDSFIIYYMFWFLEELAERDNQIANIKLIEGVVVAAQSFIGELIFFYFSGKIIKRFGYGMTLTVSLFSYAVRMAAISFIQHPWQLVFIEGIMQGPTYALCYSTIVGYAAHVAPEGYSATVQGIVAGMDDGLGFAIGSLLGGYLYSYYGGRGSFRIFALVAGAGAVVHAVLFKLITRSESKDTKPPMTIEEVETMLPNNETVAVIYTNTTQSLVKDSKDKDRK